MNLTPEQITQLAEVRLKLAKLLESFLEGDNFRTNRIVFLLQEGWEVEVVNTGAMERYYARKEHGEDERKHSQGGYDD